MHKYKQDCDKNCESKLTHKVGAKNIKALKAEQMSKKIKHDNKKINGSFVTLRKTITIDADKGYAKIPLKKYYAAERSAIT